MLELVVRNTGVLVFLEIFGHRRVRLFAREPYLAMFLMHVALTAGIGAAFFWKPTWLTVFLGFEVWYYIFFGVILFGRGMARIVGAALLMVAIGPKVLLMFPVWLMGVAVYKIVGRTTLSRGSGWALLLLPVMGLVVYHGAPIAGYQQPFMPVTFEAPRFISYAQDYFIAVLFSLHLIGFARVGEVFAPFLERHQRSIRWIAGGTFSIYLFHMPLLRLIAALVPFGRGTAVTTVTLLALTLPLCYALAELSERRKDCWRGMFERSLRAVPSGRE